MRSLTRARASLVRVVLLCVAVAITVPTQASETISYTYDALGRLVQVSRSGSVNNGASASYTYDKADNRTNVTVTAGTSTTCGGISFSIASNGPVTEGTNSVFTVTKNGSTTASCSVAYATADGTATSASDYTSTPGILTFSSAQSSLTVSVPTTDDAAAESAETFTMSLSNPTSPATIGTGTATATINDNDTNPCAGVSFTIASNAAVTEGQTSGFTVTKSGSTSSSCSVSYATASGTAASGTDFNAASGTLTFTSGQTSQIVNVTTTDDAAAESAETFTMSLSSPSGGSALGTPSSATATINDNDPCAGVSFTIASNGAVTEGQASGFTVTKSGTTSNSCSVNYATAGGTATSGSDFTAASGTLTFTSAQTSQSVSVPTTDDATYESAETFTMSLSSPSGGSVLGTPNGATATINDNDPVPPTVINLTSGGPVNLRTVANSNGYSGSSTASYQFVVGSSVTITGASAGGIGIDTGIWPAGVTLSLQINSSGIVRGGGGRGGNGGGVANNQIFAPQAGGAGGDAVRCNAPVNITVASGGTVQAGGGGGGGGGVTGYGFGGPVNGYTSVVPGAGGGGGAPNGAGGSGANGYNTVTSVAGSAGTTSGGGAGGNNGNPGGAGGTYGAAGAAGTSGSAAAGGSGGAAGYAVRKNGTGCTVTNSGTVTGTVG